MIGAVIVAAGRGERLGGGIPKCMRELAGKPLYQYSIAVAEICDRVDAIALVAPTAYLDRCREQVAGMGLRKLAAVVAGGATRRQSVLIGLDAHGDAVDWCAVHDAARPRSRPQLWDLVIDAAQKYGGAIAAVPATDTMKHAEDATIRRTLDRSSIWLAQTPQVFRTDELRLALVGSTAAHPSTTDEAEAMERAGHTVRVVAASADNFKVSTPSDWQYAEYLVAQDRF